MRIRHLFQRFYLLLFISLIVYLHAAMYLRHTPALDRASTSEWMLWMTGLALLVSIAAYPAARRLSARLGRLQATVAEFGRGRLQTRAKVEGVDEVAQLAQGFNDAAERVESLLGAHRRLLAHASHELRTPLTRIRLGIELVLGDAPSPQRTALQQDLRELDDLIEEILLSSRLDALPEDGLALEAIDLPALLAEETARYAEVELTISGFDPASAALHGDPRLLRRALRNLLDNALRHGAAPIQVRLSAQPGRLEIRVGDAGPGVPQSERERVFEPFYRGQHAEENQGHGLGLALVRQIARRHGGDVCCETAGPQRSEFVLSLPTKHSAK